MMKFKFILSAAVLAGTAVTGFADGYQDGVEYYQVGQGENAKIVLDQTINDPETNKAVAYYYLGNIALSEGNKTQASKYFDLGIQNDAQYAFNYIGKGAVALKENNANAAKDFFKQADKFGKKEAAKVKVEIARTYYNTDSIVYKKEYQTFLKDAKKKNKNEGNIYLFEGDMLANQKDYGNSAGYYEMAINFNPEDPIAYVKYANTYFHIAPAVAIEKLKTIADQKPNSLLSQRELAEKYYENNQWTKAVEQYKKVIENPNHFESDESRYAVLLYFAKDYTQSIEWAEKLLAKNFRPFLMKRMLFLNKVELGEMEDAAAAAQSFFTMPEDKTYTFTVNDYTTYADVLKKLGLDSLAVDAYEKAIKVNPKQYSLYQQLSLACIKAASAHNPEPFVKAAEAYQKFIDGQEYGKDYDLNNLLTLLSRYTNAAAFVKDPELKKAMFDRGMEVFKAIDEKADKTSNYAVVLQRKASLMNGYYGANVNGDCAKTYQEALDAMAKDANMSEQLKNSIAYEANLYIATYAQVAENNMAKAKEHYEKAYTAKPNDQLRKFIDAQFK